MAEFIASDNTVTHADLYSYKYMNTLIRNDIFIHDKINNNWL